MFLFSAPAITIKAEIEESSIMGEVTISQYINDDGTTGQAWIKVFVEASKTVDITSVSLLEAISTENVCPEDRSGMESIISLTKFFDSNGTSDATAMDATTDTTIIQNDGEELEDFDAARAIQRILRIEMGGSVKCVPFKLEESEDVHVLDVQFSECKDYSSSDLIEVLSKRTGISKSMILDVPQLADRSAVVENNCSKAKIAFISKFGNEEQLRKLYMALYSTYELGRFSPSDSCKTDIKGSFISGLIIKAFVENKPETPEKCPTVAGKDWQKVVYKYKQQAAEYDIAMTAYKKKYADILGIEGKGSEKPSRPMLDWQGDKKSKPTEDTEEESFYRLAKYIGMQKNPELAKKENEIKQLVSNGILSSSQKAKLTRLQGELETLAIQEADTRERTFYGLCLVSLRGEGSVEKLEEIKGKLDEAGWGAEGDKILRQLITEGIRYNVGEKSFKDIVQQMLGISSDFPAQVLSKKLLLGFGIQSECVNDGHKQRVLLKMMRIKYFMANVSMIDPEDTESMEGLLNATAALFSEENAMNTGEQILLRMLFPELFNDDSTLTDNMNGLLDALSEEDERKLKERMLDSLMEGDMDALMFFNVLLADADSLDGDCGLTDLAKKVFGERADMAGDGGEYGNDMPQYEYQAPRTYGNQQGNGRMQYEYNSRWGSGGYTNQRQGRNAGCGRNAGAQIRRQGNRFASGGNYDNNTPDSYPQYNQMGSYQNYDAFSRNDWSRERPDNRYSRSEQARMDGYDRFP